MRSNRASAPSKKDTLKKKREQGVGGSAAIKPRAKKKRNITVDSCDKEEEDSSDNDNSDSSDSGDSSDDDENRPLTAKRVGKPQPKPKAKPTTNLKQTTYEFNFWATWHRTPN